MSETRTVVLHPRGIFGSRTDRTGGCYVFLLYARLMDRALFFMNAVEYRRITAVLDRMKLCAASGLVQGGGAERRDVGEGDPKALGLRHVSEELHGTHLIELCC